MRILVATSTFPRWRGDREPPFVFELCRRLSEAHDVLVLAPHCRGASVAEDLAPRLRVERFRYAPIVLESLAYEGGIPEKLRRARWRHLLIPPFLWSELRALLRLIRTFDPDVIHAHWLVPQGAMVMLARLIARSEVPFVCTSHGSDFFGLRGATLDRLKAAVLRRSAAVTVVSAAMKQLAVELRADPACVHVMPMGVDARERFIPGASARSDAEILFVGRLISGKGLETALKALVRVRRAVPHASLTIVGDGPLRSALEAQASELGLESGVRFVGSIPNGELPEFYRRAAVLVLPSVGHEGFGLVIAEALACECAVVASALPGIMDLVEDEATGLLFRQADAADLAAKITQLLRDRELAGRLARAGRARVLERFDWQSVARGYGELLAGLAAR